MPVFTTTLASVVALALQAPLAGTSIAANERPLAGAEVSLVLKRADDSPQPARKTLPWPVTRGDERAIGRKLLEPVLAAKHDDGPGGIGEAALTALARVDPERMLDMLENRVVSARPGYLQAVALGVFEDNPREALAIIESDHAPPSRSCGYLALFRAASAGQAELRRDLLERALAESRRVDESYLKAGVLAQIGDAWVMLGDRDRAAPILRNARALVARVNQQQYPPFVQGIAGPVGVVDLEAAVAIAERRDYPQSASTPAMVQMELGEIAWRIAAANPAEAERLLDRLGPPTANRRDESILRACQKMAAVDLDRSLRIAAKYLRPPLHPRSHERLTLELYARAAMADALAGPQPAAARRLLEESIKALAQLAQEDRARYERPAASCLIAACLPLAERIAPDRVDEFLAMAVARASPGPGASDVTLVRALAILAALVARYDPPAAEVIARPVFDRIPDLVVPPFYGGSPFGFQDVFTALSGLDPRRAADLIERLPEDHEYTDSRLKALTGAGPIWVNAKSEARVTLARMLGLPIVERRQEIGKLVNDPWLLSERP